MCASSASNGTMCMRCATRTFRDAQEEELLSHWEGEPQQGAHEAFHRSGLVLELPRDEQRYADTRQTSVQEADPQLARRRLPPRRRHGPRTCGGRCRPMLRRASSASRSRRNVAAQAAGELTSPRYATSGAAGVSAAEFSAPSSAGWSVWENGSGPGVSPCCCWRALARLLVHAACARTVIEIACLVREHHNYALGYHIDMYRVFQATGRINLHEVRHHLWVWAGCSGTSAVGRIIQPAAQSYCAKSHA